MRQEWEESGGGDSGVSLLPSMDFVFVGKIVASFGLQGWVKVLSLSDSPSRFFSGASLWMGKPEGEWREVLVKEVIPQGKVLLVHLESISSRQEAEALRGFFLAIRRESLPPLPEGRFYHFELLGLLVREGQKARGRVTSVIEGPSYDYLTVEGEGGREFLLPFLRVYVREINLKEKVLEVQCPEGFWE
ncbi:MAG: ribosome maturation factor RimM [Candidatus Caldatribacteriaceae bacterium]